MTYQKQFKNTTVDVCKYARELMHTIDDFPYEAFDIDAIENDEGTFEGLQKAINCVRCVLILRHFHRETAANEQFLKEICFDEKRYVCNPIMRTAIAKGVNTRYTYSPYVYVKTLYDYLQRIMTHEEFATLEAAYTTMLSRTVNESNIDKAYYEYKTMFVPALIKLCCDESLKSHFADIVSEQLSAYIEDIAIGAPLESATGSIYTMCNTIAWQN